MIQEHEARSVLGVPIGATPAELRYAFRCRVLETHPDKHPGDARATVRLMKVLAAYELLRHGPAATQASPSPPAPVPVPASRFQCPCCEDSFEVSGACTRCEIPLWDSFSSRPCPSVVPDPAVERLIKRLESPSHLRLKRIDPARLPYYVSVGLASAGFAIAALGPIAPGLAISSYGLALGALVLFSDARLEHLAARFQ